MIDAKPLAGERILITGASSGLGAHIARLAVDAGAEVVGPLSLCLNPHFIK